MVTSKAGEDTFLQLQSFSCPGVVEDWLVLRSAVPIGPSLLACFACNTFSHLLSCICKASTPNFSSHNSHRVQSFCQQNTSDIRISLSGITWQNPIAHSTQQYTSAVNSVFSRISSFLHPYYIVYGHRQTLPRESLEKSQLSAFHRMPTQPIHFSPRHPVLKRSLEHTLGSGFDLNELSSSSFQQVLHMTTNFLPAHPALHVTELYPWCVMRKEARLNVLAGCRFDT